jgi:periplasmic divalent cation tolerance protein
MHTDELEVISITTTVGSAAAAKTLAQELLARRLAACVQIDEALTSVYRWKSQICDEPEVRLVIKSVPGCEAAIAVLFASHHPYELPQFLVQRMRASAAYAEWVRSEAVVPGPT